MVIRSFTARATREGARAYGRWFHDELAPKLDAIEGHRGALVLHRADPTLSDGITVTVLTFWESMKAVERFAGDPPDRAVVEPEAAALLRGWDERVIHDEIGVNTLLGAGVPRPDRQSLARPIGAWIKGADEAITAAFDELLGARGLTRLHWQLLSVAGSRPTRAAAIEAMRLFADEARVDGSIADLHGRGWLDGGDALALSGAGKREQAALAREVGALRARITRAIGEDGYVTLVALLSRLTASLGR